VTSSLEVENAVDVAGAVMSKYENPCRLAISLTSMAVRDGGIHTIEFLEF